MWFGMRVQPRKSPDSQYAQGLPLPLQYRFFAPTISLNIELTTGKRPAWAERGWRGPPVPLFGVTGLGVETEEGHLLPDVIEMMIDTDQGDIRHQIDP